MTKGFFIASTGQNIGKTTLSLGLLSGLKKRDLSITYMKPVGQELGQTETGLLVDKDVVLVKEYFQLTDDPKHMSPILVTPGFTKDFLDGVFHSDELLNRLLTSYKKLIKPDHFFLAEGTGHVGVGSIMHLNNAEVAKQLGLPVLLIASGGLGSAFDELTLNKTICDLYGVKVLGVILNRVRPEKKEMIDSYMKKALKRWDLPLLGCIPYSPLLSHPSIHDLETLLEGAFISGQEFKQVHFEQIRLIAASATVFCRETIKPNQLIITPANREDIILATLEKHQELKKAPLGMILTGQVPPKEEIIKKLQKANLPVLYTEKHSDETLEMIHSFTAKIQKEDKEKISQAIQLIEESIDFDLLLRLI